MSAMKQSCRSCALWDLARATNSAGQVRKGTVAPCLWVSSEKLPSSAWRWNGRQVSWMERDDGTDCQCYTKRATSVREGEGKP